MALMPHVKREKGQQNYLFFCSRQHAMVILKNELRPISKLALSFADAAKPKNSKQIFFEAMLKTVLSTAQSVFHRVIG